MNYSNFLGLNLPSRDNTTDIADINAISENFETIDGAFLDLVEKEIPKLQTKENINLNFDDSSTNEEQYPSVPAVVNFTNRKVDPLKIVNSASGNAISLKYSANDKLQGLKLYGKTTQDGTPTPTSPIELKSVGDSGSYSVGVYGKNLLEVTATTKTVNGVTFTVNADKSITVNGTATANVIFDLGIVKNELLRSKLILKGGVFGNFDTITFYMASYDATGEVGSCTDWNGTGTKVNLKGETGWARIFVKSGYTVNNKTFYPMLYQESLTDTTYEPYKAKQTLTLTGTLRGVGEVADEKDFARGVTTKRFNVVDLSTLSWEKFVDTRSTYWQTKGLQGKIKPVKDALTLSNILATNYVSAIWKWGEQTNCISCNTIGTVACNNGSETEAPSGMLVYELATPIEIPISETELNAYRQLHTNKPNTTLISEADMEISYVADTKLYIDNKLAELTALTLEV